MTPTPPRPTRDPSGPSGPFGGRNATIATVVVAVVVVIVGFVVIGSLVGGGNSNNGVAQTQPTVTQTPTQPPGHTQQPPPVSTPPTTATPPHEIALHCSAPPAIPSNPQQWKTPPPKTLAQASTWNVTLKTNCGNIVMALDGKDAPQTVSSFLFLSQHHFYDDTKCHRLTTAADGIYVLQCGDPTGTGTGGPGYSYGMENAPANGQYPTGTVAMARATDPNSNGSQFFIVYQDTSIPDPTGYSIFGTVTSGLQIVQAIAERGVGAGSEPAQPISILSVSYTKA